MSWDHREQGETRRHILDLLRRNSSLTAAELSEAIGIGAVGIRQHLALLERDDLVQIVGVRRAVGRPSQLYALTPSAAALFPKSYDRLAMDILSLVESDGGLEAVGRLFAARRSRLAEQYGARLAGKSRGEQIAELVEILNEQGYMCESRQLEDGSYVLTQHNCPIDCVAREHTQACTEEITLYQDLLGADIRRDESIAEGGSCCRYHIVSS